MTCGGIRSWRYGSKGSIWTERNLERNYKTRIHETIQKVKDNQEELLW